MKIGLYVHIPFCHSKCYYCDFLSFPNKGQEEVYVDALVKEIENYGLAIRGLHTISSLFIGGGTPTVLPPFLLDRVCEAIRLNFDIEKDAEWTVESNPGTILEGHVESFKRNGVNRVSLGLQAVQDSKLKEIGRIHVFEDWKRSIHLLRSHGLTNINTDIMFALPAQTLEEWEETIETMIAYDLPHISAYSLIIEEGTVFGKRYDEGKLQVMDEEVDRQMYECVKRRFQEAGYKQYEISNWSKEGLECQHNILYWECGHYLGLGLGAHGYMGDSRYHNTASFEDYIQAAGDSSRLVVEKEEITPKIAMEEFMFLGLRMLKGISIQKFYEKFGVSIFEIYREPIEKWMKEGILIQNKDRLFLSSEGVDLSNQVFVSFLLD